jgi:hypothetical protein
MSEHVSDLALDRHLAGETPAPEHLAGCAECTTRLEALRAERAGFAALPEIPFLAARTEAAAKRSRWLGVGAAGAALAAAVLLALLPRGEEVRTKGGDDLQIVVRRHDGAVEHLASGDRVAPGEAIRFVVDPVGERHVSIIGIDSAGVVTSYAEATVGAREALPGSIVLDETLGPERVVALFCNEPLDAEAAIAAGRRALAAAGGDVRHVGTLDVGCREAAVVLEKAR